MAEIKSAAQVALEAGNSSKMLFEHYRELVTETEAKDGSPSAPRRCGGKRMNSAVHADSQDIDKQNIVSTLSINRLSTETMISVLGEKEAMAKLGSRLRQERLRRNLSQHYLSEMVGVTLPTYRKIEQGNGSVEFRHVARALGVLGYSEALGEIIAEVQPEVRLKDLLAPDRKHASPRQK